MAEASAARGPRPTSSPGPLLRLATRLAIPSLFLGLMVACAGTPVWTGFQSPCEAITPTITLPPVLAESSGVVASTAHPGLFWSHNDSSHEPVLYAFDREGSLSGEVRVTGARNIDWEDLAIGPCRSGNCLYIADTGDNQERRGEVQLYRVPEPAPEADATDRADVFPMVFPDGPRDVEGIFLLPGERLYLISKGRNHPVELYRYPGELRANEPVLLERIQFLTRRSPLTPRHVTGAAATEDGRIVAVRTYETLLFHRYDAGRLLPIRGGFVNLRSLREQQGEAVALLPGNRVVLTSEAGPFGSRAAMVFLSCEIPGVTW